MKKKLNMYSRLLDYYYVQRRYPERNSIPIVVIHYSTLQNNAMAVVELRKGRRNSSHFIQYSRNVTSQHGEDGILQEIFSLIGLADRPTCIGL